MKLSIQAHLDYQFNEPTDILLQLEAAHIPEQSVETHDLALSHSEYFARVPSHDMIGERIWLNVTGRLLVDYSATVSVNRLLTDYRGLAQTPPRKLPGEAVQYLFASRYCPSDRFHSFVEAEFAGLSGGQLIAAMRDWIHGHIAYTLGSSDSTTNAADTFISRNGICRDFAHLLITLARAADIPARIVSVYACGVEPPDFHAVAEVFLGGEWHLVDATGMADEGQMAKIGVGRDAADVAFMTAFGSASMNDQRVSVVLA